MKRVDENNRGGKKIISPRIAIARSKVLQTSESRPYIALILNSSESTANVQKIVTKSLHENLAKNALYILLRKLISCLRIFKQNMSTDTI